ncbi:MAG: nucleotide sugar dehydrogenase [Actinobacteria bacterium]|nr:nucleotide sugar dehydrogenase [Actinomycetota bacterium]
MLDDPIAFLRDERWTVGILGLGYVGLPIAVAAARKGLAVVGFDVAARVVDGLTAGRSHVGDVDDDALGAALDAGMTVTGDPAALADADVLLVCVPSPLGRNRQPDTSYIEAAADTVASVARPGQVVALESTTYPGSTEDAFVPAVERAGLTLDEDVWVAFSPERVDPGNQLGPSDIPKVVGGVTPRSGEVAAAAYGRLVSKVHVVSSARAAELTKLLENTYRAVNIALVNELAQLAHELDIDIWEVIEAAATKPFGFQAFAPGPGVGGHCIPLDPQYLAWRARELKFPTRFIDLAQSVNEHMPIYVVDRLTQLLNDRGLPLRGTRILALGIAYKRDVADDRESPALDVLRLLALRGADIGVLDPHVPTDRIAQHGYVAVGGDDPLADWDLALVLTDHTAVDYARVAGEVGLVFDTRDAYRTRGLAGDAVVAL